MATAGRAGDAPRHRRHAGCGWRSLRLSRRLRKHDLAGLTPEPAVRAGDGRTKSGPLRLGDLAAAERIAPSTLTRLVNVLEELGYVRSGTPDPATPGQHAHRHRRAGTTRWSGSGEETTSVLADILRTLSR